MTLLPMSLLLLPSVVLQSSIAPVSVVLQTEGFEHLEQSCPSLLSDLLATVAVVEDSSPASRKRSAGSNIGFNLIDGVDSSGRQTRRRL